MRSFLPTVLLLAVASVLHASGTSSDEPFSCGSSPENDARQRDLAQWVTARRPAGKAATATTPNGYAKDNVVVLTADDTTAPFFHLIDLRGKTLTFTRDGNQTFSESTGPLAFEDDLGTKLSVDANKNATYTIAGFDFPFFDRTTRTLYISQLHGIYPDAAPPLLPRETYQMNEAEVVTPARAVIAPLLTTQRGIFDVYPDIYVREASDRVVVTWGTDAGTGEAIQAVLKKNGDIVFSYRAVGATRNGSLLITSGHEAWRSSTPIITFGAPVSNSLNGMIDIVNATVARITDTNLLRITLKLREPIDRSKIDTWIAFSAYANNLAASFFVYPDPSRDGLRLTAWARQGVSPAGSFDGDTVTFTIGEEMLLPFGGNISLQAYDGATRTSDNISVPTEIAKAPRAASRDFARATTLPSLSGPIVETFTLPVLNVAGVLQEVQGLYRDEDFSRYDAVAIYQNFATDLVFYAGAYSTGGNPGVDHIDIFGRSSSDLQRMPALMHMNLIRYSHNTTDDDAGFVLMHELGHRWLLTVNISGDDGKPTTVLNPLTAHPAMYVNTPAAFRVYTDRDASVMGGSNWEDLGGGNFRTPSTPYVWSYSWLDLYLMGLAGTDEVLPFFYIADSSPVLGQEYSPPAGNTYHGVRKNVTMDKLIAAMGRRAPAYPDTQRVFRVLFVVLSDPGNPVVSADLQDINRYRHMFERNFLVGTGGRGAVTTTFLPSPPPKRRIAR